MQKWILWMLLSGCVFNNANAKDCTFYRDKIRKLEDSRRHGGSLKQMERWRIQSDELTSKEHQCSKNGAIQITSGTPSPATQKTRNKNSDTPNQAAQKFRKSNNQDPRAQQLLSTCNYWIEQHNNNPSADNKTFKDSACRNVDDALTTPNQSQQIDLLSSRSLRDCIKPNNLIDNDVQECRKGLRNPTWKH